MKREVNTGYISTKSAEEPSFFENLVSCFIIIKFMPYAKNILLRKIKSNIFTFPSEFMSEFALFIIVSSSQSMYLISVPLDTVPIIYFNLQI